MKNISIKLFSLLFFLCPTISAFADASNPEEPPEDTNAVPIEDHLWILALLGIALIYYKFYKKSQNNLISKELDS